jgi:uncharacterized membrane protein
MSKTRLEAFSDGVIAIIITIMVLELQAPEEATPAALQPLIPVLLSYVLSFVYVGIYWSNHHHLLQAVRHVDGAILWANLHLLFWLSLIPFTTAWMGETHFAAWPSSIYGMVLLGSAIAYYVLVQLLIRRHGHDSTLARAMGTDFKGKISPVFYIGGITLAFVHPYISEALYVAVALMWVVPDRRIEKALVEGPDQPGHGRSATQKPGVRSGIT